MGLNVVVGVLGNAEDNHTSMVRAELVAIGKLLERAGAPQWAEPELDDGEGADFEAWGCAGLHTVGRLAVRLAASERLPKKARGGYRLRPRSASWNHQAMTETSRDDGHTFRREIERVVNEIAQGLRTLDDGSGWFSGLAPTRRQEVLQEVAGYAMQAHITSADGRAGVAKSGVKPTANPSVMICMDPPRYGFASLPANEHVKAFRVLVSVFTVADTRRRETYCKGTCGHAWHNLPAENVQP
ncbi:DUF5958 family protein [Streptomyces antibioticus]|uniref:Uncharacterized protein n=2 Tax=Streptomyces antibioticus TaxID=1890 RepID=A0AAE6Y3K3_STRAT|nr:DUF5958 family protein [Streptomyces antibioticus]MCX5166587.1 DUF5958 family protein [Streptomyces antibioticus]QIT42267.1 hypothetical protein HCX60_00940 [Streptomyces antibioticus]